MTKDEALKLALEALKQIDEAMPFPVAKLAQKVIKEALAEPEPDYKALWQQMCERCDELDKKLAQRTWVGLTDDELFDCWESAMNGNVYTKIRVYSAIEAKLKEKNT